MLDLAASIYVGIVGIFCAIVLWGLFFGWAVCFPQELSKKRKTRVIDKRTPFQKDMEDEHRYSL